MFISFPEFDVLIEEIEPYVITLLIIIAGLITLGGAMLALFLARQLSKPIEQLVADVGSANINTESISVQGSSTELNILAKSFNQAISHIRATLEREKSFTQSVSHELRTPLMVIETNLAILKTHQQPLTVLPHLSERMLRATKSISSLTNTFLILARHDKFSIEKTPLEPRDIIHSVIDTKNTQTVNWIIECAQEIKINAPHDLFEILLSNIIDNGNKYADQSATIIVTDHSLETTNRTSQNYTDSGSSQLGINIINRICHALEWRMTLNITNTKFHMHIDFHSD